MEVFLEVHNTGGLFLKINCKIRPAPENAAGVILMISHKNSQGCIIMDGKPKSY